MGGSNFPGFNLGQSGLGLEQQRISLNLEDVILHEQKLNNILEVSESFLSFKPVLEFEK